MLMFQRKYVIAGTGLLCGIIIFFLVRIIYVQVKNARIIFTPQIVHTTLHPPQSSVVAQIINIQKTVKKEGREDADFYALTKETTLVQGESVTTDDTGFCTITLLGTITILIREDSQLDFLNGLSGAVVFRQPSGKVRYVIAQSTKPFSIRSLALLTQFTTPSDVTIQTDTNLQTVTVTDTSGDITLGYSDSQNTTQVQKLTKGQTAIFDNNASTLSIQ